MLAITPQGVAVDIVLVASVLTALGAIYRHALRPAFRFMKALGEGVSYVRAQMENNGGSTVKDSVEETAKQVVKVVEQLGLINDRVEFLETVYRKQREVDDIVAENERKIAALRPVLHLPPKES